MAGRWNDVIFYLPTQPILWFCDPMIYHRPQYQWVFWFEVEDIKEICFIFCKEKAHKPQEAHAWESGFPPVQILSQPSWLIIVVLHILSRRCQKSILENNNKKTPTNLLLPPPTQTPNYFTSFYKQPCSAVQIQKTMRDLQMLLFHFCLS